MIISPDILRKETISLLTQVDAQIKEVKEEAARLNIASEQFRDAHGNWVMIPLLAAKINALSILTRLNNEPRESRVSRNKVKER